MALEPALRIVMDGEKFKVERVDPFEARRELAQQAADEAVEAETAADIEEACKQFVEEREARRLSITEHLMVLGLRKATKDELRRIILDALSAEAVA
jgi:hypothetical protein